MSSQLSPTQAQYALERQINNPVGLVWKTIQIFWPIVIEKWLAFDLNSSQIFVCYYYTHLWKFCKDYTSQPGQATGKDWRDFIFTHVHFVLFRFYRTPWKRYCFGNSCHTPGRYTQITIQKTTLKKFRLYKVQVKIARELMSIFFYLYWWCRDNFHQHRTNMHLRGRLTFLLDWFEIRFRFSDQLLSKSD